MRPIRVFLYKKRHRSGNVTWVVRWKHPVTAQWFNLPGGKTKAEAEGVRAKLWQDLLMGKDPLRAIPQHQSLTVEELAKLFMNSPRFLVFSDHWKRVRRAQYEQVIVPAFGKQIFLTLKRDHVLRLYLSLKDRGLSHSTIRKYHLALGLLGKHFEELNPGEPNPLRTIGDFSKLFPKQAPTRAIDFLTLEELESIYAELRKGKNPTYLAMIQFLASTGLRRSEALQLEWSDIDFGTGFITVRKSKTGRARRIPLEAASIQALSVLPRTASRVFLNSKGEPFHHDTLIKPLKRAALRAGITKRVDVHMLRHSYGSNKIRAGWGLKKVSMILGHADIAMTSNVYTHLLDGDLKVRDESLEVMIPKSPVGAGSAFDNFSLSDNSEGNDQGLYASLLETMKRLTEELVKLPTDFVQTEGLSERIIGVVTAEFLKSASLTQAQRDAVQVPESEVSAENVRNVPHRFRKSSDEGKTVKDAKNKSPESRMISGLCFDSKMAIPTGVEPVTFSSGG